MASMNLDPSSALAEKYKGNRQVLEQAVLGRSGENIDPYSALRALQKLNVADRYEMMQKAMQGQPNPPSIAEQTVAQAAQAQAPQGGGLAAMPVPEESFNMAGGGLVAFADGGATSYRELISEMEYPEATPEERAAARAEYESLIGEVSKPEEFYGKRAEQIEGMREMGPQEMEQQKGLAALQAAAAMAQGSDFARGLGGALGAFGESYGKAVDAANKEKRALMEMQMNMEAAQRQEAIGNRKDALAAADAADKKKKEAATFEFEKNKFLSEDALKRREIAATEAAATAKTKDPTWQMELIRAEQAYAANPSEENRVRVEGARAAVAQYNDYSKMETAAKVQSAIATAEETVRNSIEYIRESDPIKKEAMLEAARRKARATFYPDEAPSTTNTSPDLSTISGAPKGAKLGRQTDKGWEVFDAKGNLVGYAQ